MPKEHFRTLSQTPVSWLIAAAMFAAPGVRLQAQPAVPAESAAGSGVEATMAGEASTSGDVSSSDEPSMSGADLSTSTAPPEIPVYEQPPPPEDNLVWMPGYWAWGEDIGDYYWVPGTWVPAPIVGYLWTPGYWFAARGVFTWRAGYWGPHVGFYGGINYGYGYFGRGYVGGAWRDGRMTYNSAATNVGNVGSADVYRQPVSANLRGRRAGYSGDGVQPNAAEVAAAAEYHIPPTAVQLEHARIAYVHPELRAAANSGRPPIGATVRPTVLSSATAPSVHAGTFSVMHSTSPSRPAPAAGAVTVGVATPGGRAPTTSTASVARAQESPRTSQPRAQGVQTPVERTPPTGETKQPHANSPQAHTRTAPQGNGHSP